MGSRLLPSPATAPPPSLAVAISFPVFSSFSLKRDARRRRRVLPKFFTRSSPPINHVEGERWNKSLPMVQRVASALSTDGDDEASLEIQQVLPRPESVWKRIFSASKKVQSIILLNLIAIVYSSNIPIVKEVGLTTDPAVFTMVRFAMAAVAFMPFLFKARNDCKTRAAGLELGLWVSLGYLAQALGLLTSDAAHASFISTFTVIIVPVIDGIYGAKVPILTWCGAVISLVGVAMLEHSGSPCVGDALNLLSAIFFGIHMFRTENISKTTKKENFLAILGYQVLLVASLSAVWVLFKGLLGDAYQLQLGSWSMSWHRISSFPWLPALYTGVFSTGLCLWAELDAMCNVSATETAIIYGLEPVWGAAFAWFFLGERWGADGWFGAVLIICGSLTVQILGKPPRKSKRDNVGYQMHQISSSSKQIDIHDRLEVVNSRKEAAELLKDHK